MISAMWPISILNDLGKVYYNDIQHLCSCKQETAKGLLNFFGPFSPVLLGNL